MPTTPTRYDKMIYNRCGRAGLKLPAISLGLSHNFGFDKSADSTRAKRMGPDYVDIFYSHRFDPETPLEETMARSITRFAKARPSMSAFPPRIPTIRRKRSPFSSGLGRPA